MFGLLGGLLGRGIARSFSARPMFRRPLAGLLANRAMRNVISPQRSGGGRPMQGRAPDNQQQEGEVVPPQQSAPVETTPQGQPAAQPLTPEPQIDKSVQDLREVQVARQETTEEPGKVVDERPVTAGLLDDAPPAQAPEQADKDMVAPPPQVVNQTDALTPVAPQEDSQFPAVPQLALAGLVDRLEEMPGRRSFAQEDPVPLKQADVKSQARHTANRPDMSFGLAGSWTSYTPSYSSRRA